MENDLVQKKEIKYISIVEDGALFSYYFTYIVTTRFYWFFELKFKKRKNKIVRLKLFLVLLRIILQRSDKFNTSFKPIALFSFRKCDIVSNSSLNSISYAEGNHIQIQSTSTF